MLIGDCLVATYIDQLQVPADLCLYMYEPAHDISILITYIYFCHSFNMHLQLSSGIRK